MAHGAPLPPLGHHVPQLACTLQFDVGIKRETWFFPFSVVPFPLFDPLEEDIDTKLDADTDSGFLINIVEMLHHGLNQ